MDEFYDLVARMRQAQKDYFRTRSQHALNLSKELERAVDKAVADRAAGPGLFDPKSGEGSTQ